MNNQPDIALFIPFLGGRGANKVMLDLANGFSARGLRVDFVLAEAKGELLQQLAPGVRLIDLKSAHGVVRSLPALWRYLRRERPKVLFTAMDYVNCLSLVVRRLAFVKTRVFVSSHNSLLDSAKNSPWIRDRLLPFAVRVTFRWADGIIAVSDGLADVLARVTHLPRSRVTRIYNPVVDSGFDRRMHEPLDHPWFKPGQPPVILGVGKLVFPKDFLTLIKAFHKVRAQVEARLLILGDGEKREILQTEINSLGLEKDACLHGFVANPLPYMRESRLFVLSSRYEGFGLVLAEAMACGTPVVSTDCPFGPKEILQNGRYGKLVKTGDADDLAGAMIDSLKAQPDKETLSNRGREFSLERAIDQYLRLFGFLS